MCQYDISCSRRVTCSSGSAQPFNVLKGGASNTRIVAVQQLEATQRFIPLHSIVTATVSQRSHSRIQGSRRRPTASGPGPCVLGLKAIASSALR